jgi:hypothetical protein
MKRFAAGLATALISCAAAGDPPPQDAGGPASAPVDLESAMPQSERDYIKVLQDARSRFESVHTAEARKDARVAMQVRLHELLGLNHEARDWTGRIRDVRTLADQQKAIEIEIEPEITVSTWQSPFFDGQYATLIGPRSPLYKKLEGAGVGAPVKFSAILIGGRVSSDEEMVERPQVIAKFTAIERLD